MKKAFVLPLLLILTALLVAQARQSAQPQSLVFTGITVIDATGGPARPEMTVVITGDRITEFWPTKKVRAPKNPQMGDATGKVLIPGLWGLHVHRVGVDQSYFRLFTLKRITGLRGIS